MAITDDILCFLCCVYGWFHHLFFYFQSERRGHSQPSRIQEWHFPGADYFGYWHVVVLSCCPNGSLCTDDHELVYRGVRIFASANCSQAAGKPYGRYAIGITTIE